MRAVIVCLLMVFGVLPVVGQEPVPLFAPDDPVKGWHFGNGQEFPGAKGALSADATTRRADRATVKLVGDFTNGGQYVQAGRTLDGIDIQELALWLRNPDGARITLRLVDGSQQTHQFALPTAPGDEWQRIVLPLEKFFARRGQADAVTTVAKYESWGGAKDGQWHGPARGIYLLVGKSGEAKVRTVWLSDITIIAPPAAVPGASATTLVRLDEITAGQHDWRFTRGEEFRGAEGSLTVDANGPMPNTPCLKLVGDFTKGGTYVGAIKNLKELNLGDVSAIRLRVKSESARSITILVADNTGQAHQRKGVPITADNQWHNLVITPKDIAGGEHWGGANDGKWHGPPTQLSISLTVASSADKQPTLYLADIRAETRVPMFAQPPAFTAGFEKLAQLPAEWKTSAGVSIDSQQAHQGQAALLLARPLANLDQACQVTSPTFAVVPGQWQVGVSTKAALQSPDNSYNAVVALEYLDAAGKVLDRVTLADVFGTKPWQRATQRVEIPAGVTAARFHAQLNKTHGSFWLDDLSAAYLAPAPQRTNRIDRVLFSTGRLGNLLFPADPRRVDVTVIARKPLRDNELTLNYVVRDYWGAEQGMGTAALTAGGVKDGRWSYSTAFDLAEVPLEVGRYYELHAHLPQEGEPFRAHTSFAILPEAETKRYRPEEVPFTSRNWDNRPAEYVRLSDRLGVRICGLWGNWSSKPPYKAEAPSLELCKELGMGWLTTTPAKFIELGKRDYDETALRQGVRNLIGQYGHVRPLIINLGNEPHGKGDKVKANVAAYQVLYEEIKKVDPSITVVATSVEPNEEYFRAGYGKWCDAYDFHIYETHRDVRRTIKEYQALAQKYEQVKPIWSTELGLNSQGLPRLVVATELYKKVTTFFAAGGVNMSWFGLLYPDPDGKQHGTSGDSHNVFDCRYNRYAPRLDAVAYYHAVNALAIKKFVGEQSYDGTHAFLFRDRTGAALQVLWRDSGRADVSIPLPGVNEVRVIRVDGSQRQLHAAGQSVSISVTTEPVLLLYTGGSEQLPAKLAEVALPTVEGSAYTDGHIDLVVRPAGDYKPVLVTPLRWGVKQSAAEANVKWSAVAPSQTAIRQADFTITLTDAEGRRRGELYHRVAVSD